MRYRATNWSQYNQSLINRGDITLWFSEEFLEQWYHNSHHGGQGLDKYYSDVAIQCLLTLKAVFHLPLRATQGFGQSLVKLMNIDIKIPNYSTLSRRAIALNIDMRLANSRGSKTILVDSTGLKVYGQGEWHARKHGIKQRRTWRKLHLGVDALTQEVVACVLTTNDVGDGEVVDDLLEQVEGDIDGLAGDGAYDACHIYDALAQLNAKPLIPPRKGAKIWRHGNCKAAPHPRDENIRKIRQCGLKKWKRDIGYHVRSLAETAMYRVKQLFGDNLCARTFERQCTEAFIKMSAMNTMTNLGMPVSHVID